MLLTTHYLVSQAVPKKIARLFLVSDILHNASASVPNASSYRSHFSMWKTRSAWLASRSISANWPRLAEAGGRPELDLALAEVLEGELAEALGRLFSTQALSCLTPGDIRLAP